MFKILQKHFYSRILSLLKRESASTFLISPTISHNCERNSHNAEENISIYLYPIYTGTWPVRLSLSFVRDVPPIIITPISAFSFRERTESILSFYQRLGRARATPSHYVSLGDFRRRVTRAKEKPSRDPLSRFLLASEENLEKWKGGLAARARARDGEGERVSALVGRNSFNWKPEERRRRVRTEGRVAGSTRGLEKAYLQGGGMDGGPIAAVLYPNARSTHPTRTSSLTLALHTFSRVRT